jgi:CRISPR-associated Csx3 family protein
MAEKITIDISALFADGTERPTAKLAGLAKYTRQTLEQAGNGNDIVLTGAGPVWLYLILAHELHGKARSLRYDSPVTGEIVVFDHNPE